MKLEAILERFALAANLTPEQARPYAPLCEDAHAELLSRLRPDADPEASEGPLCWAAACLALYRWAMMNAGGGGDGFSAGEVKIEHSGKALEAARAASRESLAAASHWLTDTEFIFRRTAP